MKVVGGTGSRHGPRPPVSRASVRSRTIPGAARPASTVLSMGGYSTITSSMEDQIESFAFFMVSDFLSRKGLSKSLAAFNDEAGAIAGLVPSEMSWYEASAAIGLPQLLKSNRRGRQYDTLAEIIFNHLAEEKHLRDVSIAEDEANAHLSTDPFGEDLPTPRVGHTPRDESEKIVIPEPEPEEEEELTLEEKREIKRQKLREKEAAKRKAMNAKWRERRESQVKAAMLRSSTSVEALHAKMHRASGTKLKGRHTESLPRLEGTKRIQRDGDSHSGSVRAGPARRGTSPVRTTLPPQHKPSVLADTDLYATAPGQPGSESVSNIKWMPFGARMRMLWRDMQVVKSNMQDSFRLDEERKLAQKSAVSELELEKQKEKLTMRSRKKRKCALCTAPFALVNLPLAISYKAVLDMRTMWGEKMSASDEQQPRMSKYNPVRVCRFCAQFFDDQALEARVTMSPQKLAEINTSPVASPITRK